MNFRELIVCHGREPPWRHTVLSVVALSLVTCIPAAADDREGIAFFESHIRPVLVSKCYSCHSAEAKEIKGGLLLDTRLGLRKGGDSGEVIVPGDVDNGLLLEAIKYQGLEMPPDGKLPDKDIANIETWIRMGAPDPRGDAPDDGKPDYSEARNFWSFQPIHDVALPNVRDRSWPRNSIDHFILAKLDSTGLQPSPPADRVALIRRAYFDLLGLPPTPAQVEAFVQDNLPDAYERLVDRLLGSPTYGERWAQHWLDVVRYAESEGFEYDRLLPGAWRYRDYVIDSLNADKPYDQFVREQLAGDELDENNHEFRIAAGFHRLGAVRRNAGNQEVASSRNEVLTERTDIIGSTFLGLTVGCARCHDHKFDPIPQKDYYRLQAYMAATHEDNVILASDEEQARWRQATKQIEEKIEQLKESLGDQSEQQEQKTRTRIEQLEQQLPPALPTLCSIVNVAEKQTPIHVLRRGQWGKLGERVTSRPLGVLLTDEAEGSAPKTKRPRSELAAWMTSPEHPLTARVMVNRIWQNHFGRGLVATANDFGKNGRRPTHPRLLDHLATRLIAGGWQIKPIHRLILLSKTYQQSSQSPHSEVGEEVDPNNTLLWHFQRRRLSAEEIRDAMLAASGALNQKAGGRSVILPVQQELVDQLYKPSQWEVTSDPSEHARRSIYLITKRNLKLPFMEVFDQPAFQTSCSIREQSTHAPQSLELLNGRIVNELAEAFARRLSSEVGRNPILQVDRAYRLATGRAPRPEESQLAVEFVQSVSLREFTLAMFNLHAFLYVD